MFEVKWTQPFKFACNVISGRGVPWEGDMRFENVSKLAVFSDCHCVFCTLKYLELAFDLCKKSSKAWLYIVYF